MITPWHRRDERIQKAALKLIGTKTPIYAQLFNIPFQTVRQLGDRSLVADTFSKGLMYDGMGRLLFDLNAVPQVPMGTAADRSALVGFGIQAHRNAYNVLYGDGHCALMGDPQETILWHTEGNTGTSHDSYYDGHLALNAWSADDSSMPTGADYAKFKMGAEDVWHTMDVAAGIDVDARVQ